MKIEKIKDIIVTTPKSESEVAAKESQDCINNGGGSYFRVFRRLPKNLEIDSRIFYDR